jgi:hypothetical protein
MRRIRWTIASMALVLAAAPGLAQEGLAPEGPQEGLAQEEPVPLAETVAPAETSDTESGEAGTEISTGRVTRASFTSEIVEREPQDSIKSLSTEHSGVAFFTELRDLDGHTVSHVWNWEGSEMARVPFVVNGRRWRVYSTKKLKPSWTGKWTVSVEDESGRVLQTESFSYVPVASEASAGGAIPASKESSTVTQELPASIGDE